MKKKIGKYEILSLLGEGGLSYVYKAYDTVLQRYVALKILKVADPILIKRFFKEAKIQSSLENENICKIYDFGEEENIYFIAMQYIDGQSFHKVIENLKMEEKIIIIIKICNALIEAHKKGLIHRDIKPSNIMIEFKEDGEVKPYLIDFGLAKEVEKRDGSFTGMVIGTIGWMAPEQIKGKPEEIDRRADIYALGVLMYYTFCGVPPFDENLETLESISEKEPIPPRKIKKDIPKELEAIILKCLEIEKIRRYQSAKELKDDLENFLSGEPVKAKTPDIFYKFIKKFKKNKRFFYSIFSILVIIFLFSSYIIYVKKIERKQRIYALEFSQYVKYIEDMLWYIYSSSTHNIKPQMDFVYEKINQFEKEFKRYGKIGLGAGHYSLGKCYIAIGDFPKALENLNIAKEKYNFKTNDLSYLLAHSNIMVYLEKKDEINIIEDKNVRENLSEKLEENYLKKSENFIKESPMEDIESWEYLKALSAFVQKDYDFALEKIKETEKKYPFFFENSKLEGKIYKNIGDGFALKGEIKKAEENYKKAEKVFLKILSRRECDPEIYKLLFSLYLSLMDLNIYSTSISPEEFYQKIIELSERQLNLNYNLEDLFNYLSKANLKMGSFFLYEGADPVKYFENSIIYAKKALEINKKNKFSYTNLGSSYLSLGAYKNSREEEPFTDFENSIVNYKKAILLNPLDLNIYNNLALTYWNKGKAEIDIGKEPEKTLSEGIKYIKKAISMEPGISAFYNTAGNLYLELAYYSTTKNKKPDIYLKNAIESYEKAIKLNPNYAFPYNNIAECYLIKLQEEIEDGNLSHSDIERAKYYAKKALNIKKDFIWAYVSSLRIELIEAKYMMSQNQDPEESFSRAFKIIEESQKIENFCIPILELKFEVYKTKAKREKESGKNYESTLKKGISEIDKIIKLKKGSKKIEEIRGELYSLL